MNDKIKVTAYAKDGSKIYEGDVNPIGQDGSGLVYKEQSLTQEDLKNPLLKDQWVLDFRMHSLDNILEEIIKSKLTEYDENIPSQEYGHSTIRALILAICDPVLAGRISTSKRFISWNKYYRQSPFHQEVGSWGNLRIFISDKAVNDVLYVMNFYDKDGHNPFQWKFEELEDYIISKGSSYNI